MKSPKLSQSLMELWLSSLSPSLRMTWEFMTPEQQKEIFAEYQAILAESFANPRKFALMAFREHNPVEHLNDPDEAMIKGVGIKKLASLRQHSAQ